MYESHFHLNGRPFSSATNPEHYFPASSVEQAREAIARNVERAASVTLLVGPVGSGKSLLCQLIANQYSSELPVCLIQGERLTSPDLFLQSVLHKLGLPFRLQKVGELRLTLTEHLTSGGCVNGILLVIDDADQMSGEVLHEIRSLTNVTKDGHPCARVLLAGSSRLEENIGMPEQESLHQRVAGRLYLESFGQQETADYIRARIAAVGGDADGVFAGESLQRVHQATMGVPRLINQICDHALILASINGQDQLTGRLIEEAWADMQQLPLPAAESAMPEEFEATDGNVVEFGELEDEVEDPTETSELAAIKEALAELDVTAVKATRPIIVGGEVEFEEDASELQAESVLPIRSPLAESESTESVEFHDSHEQSAPVSEWSEVEGNVESNDGQDDSEEASSVEESAIDIQTDTLATESEPTAEGDHAGAEELIDSVQLELERELFEFDASSTEGPVEVSFGGEDIDSSEEQSVFIFDSTEEEAEQHAFFFDGEVSVPELEAANTEEPRQKVDASEYLDIAEEGAPAFAEAPQVVEVVEDEFEAAVEVGAIAGRILPEIDGASLDSAEIADDDQLDDDIVTVASDEIAEEMDEGPEAAKEEPEQTLEQAVNPFEEEFDTEEIVLQQFVSPSTLTRGNFDPVTATASRQLAIRLSGARPVLRMHPASIEDQELEASEEFEPLSKFIEDSVPSTEAVEAGDGRSSDGENSSEDASAIEFPEEADADISAGVDPVMPEGSYSEMSEIDPLDSVEHQEDQELAEVALEELREDRVEVPDQLENERAEEEIVESIESSSDDSMEDSLPSESEASSAEGTGEEYVVPREEDGVEANETTKEIDEAHEPAAAEDVCEDAADELDDEAVIATIGLDDPASQKKPGKKRLFRTLFSSLRAS